MQQDKISIDRHHRRWFSRKYYALVMNTKEFFEDNIGKEFVGVFKRLEHDYGK